MANTQTFSKYFSRQGGPFTHPNNKMIDHEIPSGMSVDMSKSFYQFTLNFTPDLTKNYGTEEDPITLEDWYNLDNVVDTPILNVYAENTDESQYTPMNVDLIRNCTMRGRKVGQLESTMRVNVLMHNLMEMTMTTDQKLSQVDSLMNLKDPATMKNVSSAWVELHKEGNIPSIYHQPHLRLPVSHLFSLGATTDINTTNTGTIMTHLELDKFINNLEMRHNSLIPLDIGETYTQAETKTTEDNIFVMTKQYTDIEDVPFYVAQPVLLSYTTADDPPVEVVGEKAIVTSVNYFTDTRQVTLTLSTVPEGQQPFTDVFIAPFNFTGVVGQFTLETCELVVCENSMMTNQNMLAYTTFTTEEYSQGQQNFLQKTFSLPPNCVNTFIMSNGVNVSNPLSKLYSVDKYRLRINQDDVVDRDTNIQILPPNVSPLLDKGFTYDGQYWDLLSKTFINAGLPLTNLMLSNLNANPAYVSPLLNAPIFLENEKIFLIGCPVPLTQSDKLFHVSLDCREVDDFESTVSDIIVYKQVLNQVKL